jgi:hypothetical protein
MARCDPAQTVIPIVGPFESETAVIIHHAYMGTLAAPAKLLRSADRQRGRSATARAVTFAIFRLNHPDVMIPYNIVLDMRHILLPESSRRLMLDLNCDARWDIVRRGRGSRAAFGVCVRRTVVNSDV